MRELGRLAELESLWVKNFKSLKELVLDMPTRLTVVVGANGSGKTALVEVFELLTYILDWERGVISNPFAKFWGYDKVVWKHDEDLPVTIGFKLRLDGIRKRVQEIESENLRDTIMDVVKSIQLWLSKPVELKMEIAYELSITGRGGDFRILREDLLINSKDLKVSIDATKNLLTIVVDITEDLNFFVEKVKEVTKEIFFGVKEGEKLLLERLRSSRSTTELLSFYVPLLSKLGYSSKIRSYVVEVLSGLKRSQLSLILLLTLYSPELLTVPSVPSLELHAEMEEKCSVLKISATIGEDIEAGVVNPQDNIIDFFARNIMRGQSLLRLVRSVSEKLLFNTNSPKYQEILKRFKVLKERDIEKSLNVVKEIISYFIVDNLLHRASLYLFMAFAVIYGFIDGICVIKDVDWKSIKTPQSVERQKRLRPDGSNFIPFLLTLTGGDVGEVFEEVLKYAFPGPERVKVGLDITTDNRVFLKLIVNSASLTPVSIPNGVLKTLIVESVLRWRPTLLVIDEFENSLHPELQQFLMDELRASNVSAIITSHSTIPLNYVKDLREVVVLRLERGETRAYRLGEEVKERLREARLTLSDLILSGLLRPEISG